VRLVKVGRWERGYRELVRRRAGSAWSRVVEVGYVPDDEVPRYLSLGDLFVLPSRYEGFGIPLIEALAAGAPVVTTDIDARRREVFTLVDGEPAVLAPSDVRGAQLVGDGAVRYRDVFEAAGAEVPPDDDPRHLPDPLLLLERAGAFGDAALVEPLYVREPDARPQA